MKTNDFFKIYGCSERQDALLKLSDEHYVLFFGFVKDNPDDETGYRWRKDYDHKPTVEELRTDIEELIDKDTDERTMTGFVWNDKPVHLSTESRFNFKAAYDLAVQTQGATLPVKFKLGEDAEKKPIYHVFENMEEFTDFYTKGMAYINQVLNDGWLKKDAVDYDALLEGGEE